MLTHPGIVQKQQFEKRIHQEIHLLFLKCLPEGQEPVGTLSGDGDAGGGHFGYSPPTL